jgi:hypothetical protein
MYIEYKNNKGSMNFNSDNIRIIKLDVGSINNELQSNKLYGIDGYRHSSNSVGKRDISMEVVILADTPERLKHMKRLIMNIFDIKLQGQLIIGDKSINVSLSNTPYMVRGKGNSGPTYQRVIFDFECSDPYFYSKEIVNTISMWENSFEFILEIPEEGIEFASKTDSLQCSIENEGNTDTGLVAELRFIGAVTNPFIYHVTKGEKIKVIGEFNAEDVLKISTISGKKKITLTRGDVDYNYFSKLDKTSKFFTIDIGKNIIRIGCDTGEEKIQAIIKYLERHYEVV